MSSGFGSDDGTLRWLHANRVCVHCGFAYTELNNIGLWKCKRFHPLVFMTTTGDTSYRCCRGAFGSPGCVPADHSDSIILDVEDRTIDAQTTTAFLAAGVKINEKTWRKSGPGSYVVERVDNVALERHGEGEQAEIESYLRTTVNEQRPI